MFLLWAGLFFIVLGIGCVAIDRQAIWIIESGLLSCTVVCPRDSCSCKSTYHSLRRDLPDAMICVVRHKKVAVSV